MNRLWIQKEEFADYIIFHTILYKDRYVGTSKDFHKLYFTNA